MKFKDWIGIAVLFLAFFVADVAIQVRILQSTMHAFSAFFMFCVFIVLLIASYSFVREPKQKKE